MSLRLSSRSLECVDDLPTPTSHVPSAHSTPMTSPSTAYSSLFPGSLSSATSESAPSEFGLLAHGSSSYPISPLSRSTTESGSQLSVAHRPWTAPNSLPVSPAPSHSRFTTSIKNLLSRSPLPSPSRFSYTSAATAPPDGEPPSRPFHLLAAGGKWPMTPRKARPPDLEISGTVPSPMSTSHSHPPTDAHRRYASEAIAKIYNAGHPSFASRDSLDTPPRNAPLAAVRGKDPKTRNVLRRRPSGSAKLFKRRDRGMSSTSCPHEGDTLPPKEPSGDIHFPPLTAAGAVVEAYKQQELRHDDAPNLADSSDWARHDGWHDHHSPTPRVMQPGSPDDPWSRLEPDQHPWARSKTSASHQSSLSDSGARSLVRKVSTRWRKVKGSEESPLRDRGHSKGRPSLHELWAADGSARRATGRSMDGILNVPEQGAWASPSAGHARSVSEKGDGSEGGKLWRMMRRISTGGLRDRFQSERAVPPVPAIPKELLDKGERSSHEPLSSQPPSSLPDKDRATGPKNAAMPACSSDAASARFCRTHSPRSSVSSYGDMMPRITESVLDRRIITPLEQLRLADDHVDGGELSPPSLPGQRSPRRSTSVPAGLRTVEDAEGARALLPSPRRLTCSGESPSSGSSRASASESARGSRQGRGVGHGGSRMEDGTVPLSPPPRSARHSRRGGGGSTASSPCPVDGGVGIGIRGARQMDRVPSAQSDATARVDSPSSSLDMSPPRPPTFRELDAPRRPPLSEAEKADIWNDLLARSDQAGGTLHIHGTAELMSDTMRFSTISES